MTPLAQQPDEVEFGSRPGPPRRALTGLVVAVLVLGAVAWRVVPPRLQRRAVLQGIPAVVVLTAGSGWGVDFRGGDFGVGTFQFAFPLTALPGELEQPEVAAELAGGVVALTAVLFPPGLKNLGDFDVTGPVATHLSRGDRPTIVLSGTFGCGSRVVPDALTAGRLAVWVSFVRFGKREKVRVLGLPVPTPDTLSTAC